MNGRTAERETHELAGKRIIFVLDSLHLGGSERQALFLARHLKEHCGAKVEVVGIGGEPGRGAELCREYGIPLHIVPFAIAPLPVVTMTRMALCAGRLRRFRPDILLPYTTAPNILCGTVWHATGAKLCIWNQRDEGLGLKPKFLTRGAVRNTPRFVSNCLAGKEFLERTLRVDGARISLAHNGLEIPVPKVDRQAWRRERGIAGDALVACMVANIHGNKDHETLLRAWRIVADAMAERGARALLVLAGRHGDRFPAARALAAELGLEDQVSFPGVVDDVPSMLNAADLCVFSSRSEGCPNGVLEAMAAGLPVVGTDIPGIREAVGAGAENLLAPTGDRETLAANILRFAHDADFLQAAGMANIQRIRTEFSLEAMCSRMAGILLAGLETGK